MQYREHENDIQSQHILYFHTWAQPKFSSSDFKRKPLFLSYKFIVLCIAKTDVTDLSEMQTSEFPLVQRVKRRTTVHVFEGKTTLKGVKVVILITIFHSFWNEKFTSTLILE